MAKVISAFPVGRPKGAPQIHPWDEWFNGQIHELGTDDLPGSVRDMVTQLRRAAAKRGLAVRVTRNAAEHKVWVQRV